MTTNWEPEAEDEQPKKPGYEVKAHIALEDSDGQTWGIVKDTEGSLLWKTGDGQVVGTWSRSPQDGLIHVFLETSITAMVDKATQSFVEYAEKRRTTVPTPKTRGTRAPRVQKPVENEALTAIMDIRKKLGK